MEICTTYQDVWQVRDRALPGVASFVASDSVRWEDRPLPGMVTMPPLNDTWRWRDEPLNKHPYTLMRETWRAADGPLPAELHSPQLHDRAYWQDRAWAVRDTRMVEAWRVQDGPLPGEVRTKLPDGWLWQDRPLPGELTGRCADTLRWQDRPLSGTATTLLREAWRWQDRPLGSAATLLLRDEWRVQDGPLPGEVTSRLTDAWRWQDRPLAGRRTVTILLREEWFCQDRPITRAGTIAWVSHLRTLAASTWRDLPYCSAIAWVYAGKHGIYKAGDTYADAILQTDWLDFDTPQQKHIALAMVGSGAKSGTFQLGIQTDIQPQYSYAGQAYGTGNVRIKPGLGLRGRHFQLTLTGAQPVSEIQLDVQGAQRRSK